MRPWLEERDAPRHYFAYGSNMSSPRLQARLPSASPLGRALCSGYRVVCNKPSRDGSGKANLVESNSASAWGVLYQIELPDWALLDRFEPDYIRHVCSVSLDGGNSVRAGVYLWLGEAAATAAYPWYVDHILAGAREHGLPRESIDHIGSWETRPDSRRCGR